MRESQREAPFDVVGPPWPASAGHGGGGERVASDAFTETDQAPAHLVADGPPFGAPGLGGGPHDALGVALPAEFGLLRLHLLQALFGVLHVTLPSEVNRMTGRRSRNGHGPTSFLVLVRVKL
jgi:hypothetical protein